jgi:hypothetical protein
MFALQLGIPRDQMESMSVPQMVSHVDYWAELTRGGQDG